ncbi:uncharacterized protein LOC132571667 [Heteronotia binoei]|uniref:uncharacterized protein LOC132571667 n=1 Tax=Heteronotia binoei TaxID=13085 RepID=UPI00292CD57F|nr:uncharacterized protein LOC132571667 [Heteronotia binoei]
MKTRRNEDVKDRIAMKKTGDSMREQLTQRDQQIEQQEVQIEKKEQEFEEILKRHAEVLENEFRKHTAEKELLLQSHAAEIDTIRQNHEAEKAEFWQNHVAEKKLVLQAHAAELEQPFQSHVAEKEQILMSHEAKVKQMLETHEKERTRLSEGHEIHVRKIMKENNSLRWEIQNLKDKVDDLKLEKRTLTLEQQDMLPALRKAQMQVASLEKELEQAKDRNSKLQHAVEIVTEKIRKNREAANHEACKKEIALLHQKLDRKNALIATVSPSTLYAFSDEESEDEEVPGSPKRGGGLGSPSSIAAPLTLPPFLFAPGSSSPHSLRYFYTAVSEPGSGLPQFSIVGYVDDQPFTKYDSITRRDVSLVPWMEKVGKEDPQYWERNTQLSQGTEAVFRGDLVILRDRFHQKNSTGLHILQVMYGCEVGPDGQLIGGHRQDAYDGEDFIALDRETLTWTAPVPQAQETKRRWEGEGHEAQHWNAYLEETCVEGLRRYLSYGKKSLLRTEAPVWRVTRKKGHDGQETLFCQLYGFYPKGIEVAWMKDGEDRRPETLTGGVVPNSDGTYHTWLSIKVDPKERDRYRCRVGHDSLPEPLDLAWEEPASNLGLILVIAVLLVALILAVAGVIFYRKRQKTKGYKAAAASVSIHEQTLEAGGRQEGLE